MFEYDNIWGFLGIVFTLGPEIHLLTQIKQG